MAGTKTVFCIGLFASALVADASERPWVIENEDNDHYFYGRDAAIKGLDPAAKETLETYADHLLKGGEVTHIFWCVNGQRVNYDSKVWEPIWTALTDPLAKQGHSSPAWPQNAKKMFDAGIDPYKVWIDRTRAKGASPWISMRMNDNHDVWVSHATRVTRFAQDNTKYWIIPNFKGDQWDPYALDFTHPEVRDYTFALVEEIVNRYDADGIELDFLRASAYFKADEAVAKQPIMTEFIARCRAAAEAAAKKRGRPFRVAIRLAPTIEGAAKAGFNAVEIARRGLVDVIIPCNSGNTHWDLPVADWKRRIGAVAPDVRIVAGTTAWSHTPATLRGWATMMRATGADDFYIFNLHWADAALQQAVRAEGAFSAEGSAKAPRTFIVDQYDPPKPPVRKLVKTDLVPAAFKPDAWRYAVGNETPRAFSFGARRSLRKGCAPEGGDYPVCTKATLTGELVAEADGFVALGMGFDWRWELDVNGHRVFGRNALVDAQDRCTYRASDWTVRVPVKKGVNAITVVVELGTHGFGEMRVVPADELKDGIDMAPQEEYDARTKSGIAKESRARKFPAPITRALAYEREIPPEAKAVKQAAVELLLKPAGDVPSAVFLNGVKATEMTEVGRGPTRTLRAVFPPSAVRPGVNTITTEPFAEKSKTHVDRVAIEID